MKSLPIEHAFIALMAGLKPDAQFTPERWNNQTRRCIAGGIDSVKS